MQVQNLDLEEALLYLSVNEKGYLDPDDLDEFRIHLPSRKTTTGDGPGMRNEFLNNGKSWEDNAKYDRYPWHHQKTIGDSPQTRRTLLGLVVKVAIQVLFKNFCYTFGGKVY